MAVTCLLPSTEQDRYQNVPQDMNFYILDVTKKITFVTFRFLTNYVQLRDERMSISEMGGGDAYLFIETCHQK